MNNKYYIYFFYGRLPHEVNYLRKNENPLFKEIAGKEFDLPIDAYKFLKDYVDKEHTFKDIGLSPMSNEKHLCIGATSVKKLLDRLERIYKID